jgi:hypothetical protein
MATSKAANGTDPEHLQQDRIVLKFFKWDRKTESPESIDSLQPFHTTELERPA